MPGTSLEAKSEPHPCHSRDGRTKHAPSHLTGDEGPLGIPGNSGGSNEASAATLGAISSGQRVGIAGPNKVSLLGRHRRRCGRIVHLDTPPPATIDDSDLLRSLSVAWALEADEIDYVPKGVGSYHWIAKAEGSSYFITVDDLDTKPWIGRRRDVAFEGLATAYHAAWVVHHEAHFAFVVGPLRRTDGSTILRLSDQYSMAVFPFIEGHAGNLGRPPY